MATKKWIGAEKISSKHIEAAAIDWKSNPDQLGFKKSKKYDVVINGETYPPKAISALAYKRATGKILTSNDFPGAKDGFWHRILKSQGFDIVEKHPDSAMEEQMGVFKNMTDEELYQRARVDSTLRPKQKVVSILVRQRSPAVRAAALRRAGGKCQKCNTTPFLRKGDGTAYLEVHHIVPLALDGADNLENTIALCPNCHCQIHDELGLKPGDE